jgi:hypothetical protein
MQNDLDDDELFAADPDADAVYAVRQRQRDSDYSRVYRQWVASMPPEDLAKLKALGLDSAYLPCGSGGASKDAADTSRARCEDPLPEVEPQTETAQADNSDGEYVHDVLRKIIGELADQNNCRLSLDCVALVTGLSYQGLSMTKIADRHGISRAAVSKRCVELTIALRLRPSRAMRSLLARVSYRTARAARLNSRV